MTDIGTPAYGSRKRARTDVTGSTASNWAVSRITTAKARTFGSMASFKTKELYCKLVKYLYQVNADLSASAVVSARGAWGALKPHRVVAGAGVCTVNTPGAIPMLNSDNNWQGSTRLPGFLFGLTRVPNTGSGGATGNWVQAAVPFIKSDGNILWKNFGSSVAEGSYDIIGTTLQGTASGMWQTLINDQNATYPGRYAILKNTSMKLELWGALKAPTTYKIMCVQFDEDCAPTIDATSANPQDQGRIFSPTEAGNKFWLNIFKKISYHPWANTYAPKNTGMKILFQDSVYIEAKSTEDESVLPQCRMREYNWTWNRRCHFDWSHVNHATVEDDVENYIEEVLVNENRVDVDPKARIYMLVLAENFTQINPVVSEVFNSDYIPSMSMRCENTWAMPQDG